MTHRNKKPFECTALGCNKSYCDARSLRRHRENHHTIKTSVSMTGSSGGNDNVSLVSPASSITSSDMDDKSMGSESGCDQSIKGTKLILSSDWSTH